MTWGLNETPAGTFILVWYEADDLQAIFDILANSTEDDANWMRSRIEESGGIEPAGALPGHPQNSLRNGPRDVVVAAHHSDSELRSSHQQPTGELHARRTKITCQPGKTEQALEVIRHVVAPSRELEGVVHFDIARDIVDSIIATDVFEDMAALDRQNALPEVAAVIEALPGLLAAEPEATLFHVS